METEFIDAKKKPRGMFDKISLPLRIDMFVCIFETCVFIFFTIPYVCTQKTHTDHHTRPSMSKEQKEITRMKEQLARIAKVHEAKKKILLAAQRKNAVRTLHEKFEQVKERNKTLAHCNQVLQRTNRSLSKEIGLLKTKNEKRFQNFAAALGDSLLVTPFSDVSLGQSVSEYKSRGNS